MKKTNTIRYYILNGNGYYYNFSDNCFVGKWNETTCSVDNEKQIKEVVKSLSKTHILRVFEYEVLKKGVDK